MRHYSLIALAILTVMATSCRAPQSTKRPSAELLAERLNYPAHWWTSVPTNGAPSWEILPQAAGPGEVILSKRNELGLLSNFAATPFTFRGKLYASLEGFWQMMKFPESDEDPRAKFPGLTWAFTRERVAQMTAFDAKRAGDVGSDNMKRMGITWVTFERERMDFRAKVHGEFYRLIVAATREKVFQKSGSEKSPACDRRLDSQTRSSSRTQRSRRLALLRNPHANPRRTSE